MTGLAAHARADLPPVVIAPFANERIREWPLDCFRDFIAIGLEDGYRFIVSGTAAQRPLANNIVRSFDADLVQNGCGRTTWSEMQSIIAAAPFVVANNSGLAHMAASLGKWVLCPFSGSHSWIEWMPRGDKVIVMTSAPYCSPCISPVCFNDLRCLRNITPGAAYNEIRAAILESQN